MSKTQGNTDGENFDTQKSSKLILLRHGESEWNRRNLFTGWVDVPLSEKGIQEALKAGQACAPLPIDVVFTSTLIRAQMTASLALLHHSSGKVLRFVHTGDNARAFEKSAPEALSQTIPVYSAWELNERMYGELQGLNKQKALEKWGPAQVHSWRRSFHDIPPGGESLKMTAARTVPYFQEHILSQLKQGLSVFVCAHGNSLRSIVMFLENIEEDKVMDLEIATGEPLFYTFSKQQWRRDA